MKFFYKITALIFSLILTFTVCACQFEVSDRGSSSNSGSSSASQGSASQSEPQDPVIESARVNLMAGFTAADTGVATLDEGFTKVYNEFAVNIFKEVYGGENELLSPLSIQVALAMVANGAAQETLDKMQSVLFGGKSVGVYNDYAKAYLAALRNYDKVSVKVANAVWFKNTPSLTVKERFLQTNADYYGATAYKAPFDQTTLNDINGWVKEHTDGMIDKVLEEINPLALLYLLNAVAFDAEWSVQFEEAFEDTFKNAAGEKQTVDMMNDKVYAYLENDVATGFIKTYKGGRFAFSCMLPKDGETLDSVVASLSGEALTAFFRSRKSERTYLKMPKFKLDYSVKLNEVLSALGMGLAFNPDFADFSEMATLIGGNIYVGNVIHKTAIEVTEVGTRAAAVTAVTMEGATASWGDEPTHYVYLNRPFIYFLLDTRTLTPLFMGEISSLS